MYDINESSKCGKDWDLSEAEETSEKYLLENVKLPTGAMSKKSLDRKLGICKICKNVKQANTACPLTFRKQSYRGYKACDVYSRNVYQRYQVCH